MSRTGPGTWFADYAVGDVVEHARGKTVTPFDGAFMAQLVLNTSDGHFNDDVMAATPIGESVVFGGLTLAMVVGLAMQDTGENASAELGLAYVRLRVPVVHGDSLYAVSEVLESVPDAAGGGGVVRFRHRGRNQRGETVLECERSVHVRGEPRA